MALGALLSLLGENGDRALVLVCLLSHAALVFGAYRLGSVVFGLWPGLLAAAFVGASASFLLYAARAYVDAPFLALVVWAAVLVAQERRGWVAPMALLVLAGLLRPEAWVLAVLYWLWVGPRRPAVAAAALLAPVLWVLVDWAATGDPLHSFNATTELADDLGREQGLAAVPGSFVSFISATVRPPVALLAVIGLALALWLQGWKRTRVPLALLAAGIVTFVGTGVLGLSILPRYLTVPAVAMCVFAGYALAGFTTLPRADPLRRRWTAASIVAAVVGAVVIVVLAPSLSRVSDEVSFIRTSHDRLVALLDEPRVRAGMQCGPLTFPNYRLVPDARWHLDLPPTRVGARSDRRRAFGVAVFVLTPKGLRRFGFADGASTSTNVPDPGFVPLARNDRFSAYARCPSRPLSIPRLSIRSHSGWFCTRAVWLSAHSRSSRSGFERTPAWERSASAKASGPSALITARSHVRTPESAGVTVRRPSRAYLMIR